MAGACQQIRLFVIPFVDRFPLLAPMSENVLWWKESLPFQAPPSEVEEQNDLAVWVGGKIVYTLGNLIIGDGMGMCFVFHQ